MKYIIADKKRAKDIGFVELGHAVNGNLICLNEKEVMNSKVLTGTLTERAETLCGCVSSFSEAKMIMSNTNNN